jgi:NhaP-type Na+/H+ or K+/H+ antiporter
MIGIILGLLLGLGAGYLLGRWQQHLEDQREAVLLEEDGDYLGIGAGERPC